MCVHKCHSMYVEAFWVLGIELESFWTAESALHHWSIFLVPLVSVPSSLPLFLPLSLPSLFFFLKVVWNKSIVLDFEYWLWSCNFMLINANAPPPELLECSFYLTKSSINKDRLISSIPTYMLFDSFSCLVTPASTFSTLLKRSSESGSPCLFLILEIIIKWNKPGAQRQIAHGFTHLWNLKKPTSEKYREEQWLPEAENGGSGR